MPPVRLLAALGRVLDALPPPVQVRLSGRAPVEVDGQRLDPGVQLMIAAHERFIPPATAVPPVEELRQAARVNAAMGRGRPAPVADIRDLRVSGGGGELAARHYAAAADGAPLLVYFHGGGGVTGDLDTHDSPCRALCHHGGVHVLAVDYRLAPEAPFPCGVDDGCGSWSWAVDHAADLGADPGRVAVAGDSAGGSIAAAVAQAAARGEVAQPAAQLLIYPWLDLTRRRRSHELFGDGFLLPLEMLDVYAEHLVGDGGHAQDPRCSPLLAGGLSGLAPAIVVTAGFDPLRDEGEDYARALRAEGVPVLLRRFDSLTHGFLSAAGVNRASRAAMVEIAGMLRATLALGPGQVAAGGAPAAGRDRVTT